MKGVFLWNDIFFLYEFSKDHPINSERFKEIFSYFKVNFIDKGLLDYREVEEGDESILTLFHTKEYIDKIKILSEREDIDYSQETPIFKNAYKIVLYSVWATLEGVNLLLNRNYEFAVNLVGGWHHAFEDKARGFCIFNDIVIAGRYLVDKKNLSKVMIIDWDTHHGDGVQKAFYNDNRVFTISIHQHPHTLYPYFSGFEKENNLSNLNIPLEPFSSDEEIKDIVLPKLQDSLNHFKPEFLIIQMGTDAYKDDLISMLSFTKHSYELLSSVIAYYSKDNNIPVLLLGGGGFSDNKSYLYGLIVKQFLNL